MNEVSEAKILANKRNAKRGGVKTEKGKSVVRHNARRHGILAELKTKYEGNAYDGYLRRLHDEYDPQSFMEKLLVERIAVCCLMLYRATKAEREFMLTRLNPPISDRIGFIDYDDESYRPVIQHDDIEHLTTIYLRYQTTIENRLYKAMHELERMQRMRRGEHVARPVAVDVEEFLNTLKTASEDYDQVTHDVKDAIANLLVLNTYVAHRKVASIRLKPPFDEIISHPLVVNGGAEGI